MSAINRDAQRALTEKRGKELDRWIEMRCIRFMRGIEPFSLTLSDLPTEIIHHVVEKMEPVDILSSREVCRNIRNVVNKFALRFGGILLFLKNNKVSEQVSPTFSGMPTKIINQVVEKMEPIDRLRASKACRSLKTAVDQFGLRFDYIRLISKKDKIEMWFGGTETIYTTAANGNLIVNRNGQESIIDGENFVERAVKDFKIVSKHARKIGIDYMKDSHDIFTTFIEFLKIEKCILVEEIDLWNFSFDEILTILPSFDAKVLKKMAFLEYVASNDHIEQITHLEQWKKAENFELSWSVIASTVILNSFHFKSFIIHQVDEFSAQTAIQIRDDLLRRSAFQSCDIKFEKSKTNPIEIAKVFKPDYAGGNYFKIEFSNGNDKFDISLEKERLWHYRLNVKRCLK